MNPLLILLAIRGALRLAQTGEAAFKQYATDHKIELIVHRNPLLAEDQELIVFFHGRGVQAPLAPEILEQLDILRTSDRGSPSWSFAVDVLSIARKNIKEAESAKQQQNENEKSYGTGKQKTSTEVYGYYVVKQWRDNKGPISPFAQIVISLVDIGLEVAAAKPDLFGVGSHAEPFIRAITSELSAKIPDDPTEITPEQLRLGSLAGLLLRSGLNALSKYPDILIEEKQYQALVTSVTTSLSAALPQDVTKITDIESIFSAVTGSLVSTVAKNPEVYFGHRFGENKFLGALTRDYLLQIGEQGVLSALSKEGAVALYQSALSVVAKCPELVIGTASAQNEGKLFATALVRDAAAILQTYQDTFGRGNILKLADQVLQSAADNADIILQSGKSWQNLLSNTLPIILEGIRPYLRGANTGDVAAGRSFIRLETGVELARVFLDQVSKTPAMLNTENDALDEMIGAVAKAMAADKNLLLSEKNWLEIASITANSAAENFGKLFGVGPGNSLNLLSTSMVAIVDGLKPYLTTNNPPASRRGMSGTMAVNIIRAVLNQASKTPRLLGLGSHNEELSNMVSAVASAMANDKKLLLSDDDWLQIAAVAAESAANNPGRLFGTGTSSTLTAIIQGLLDTAALQWSAERSATGVTAVLAGPTLRDAIVMVIRAAEGNMTAVLSKKEDLLNLTNQLAIFVAKNPGSFGSKEWSALYRKLLYILIAGGELPVMDEGTLLPMITKVTP